MILSDNAVLVTGLDAPTGAPRQAVQAIPALVTFAIAKRDGKPGRSRISTARRCRIDGAGMALKI